MFGIAQKNHKKLSPSQTLGIDNKPLNCRVVMAVVVLCVCKKQIKGGNGRRTSNLWFDLRFDKMGNSGRRQKIFFFLLPFILFTSTSGI
jgi:hypothetical protein